MDTNHAVSHRDALDIVFANRNQAYGAYQLRRNYPAALRRALGIGLLFVGFLVVLPHVVALFAEPIPEEKELEVIVCMCNMPDLVLEQPKPLPKAAASPPRATIAFRPPFVLPDEVVPENDVVQAVNSILDDPRSVGSQTDEGHHDGPPFIESSGDGLHLVETSIPEADEPLEGFEVDRMPSFPGGDVEMYKWLYQHIIYPELARQDGIEGQVVLTFVVGKSGEISDISLLKVPAGGGILGKEAVRVVQSMPKWSPAEVNGRPVNVRYTLPLHFALK